ncbi:MAG TPA: serine hydrolase [Bacteroidales bacterium]|nr:serine hydrolase [Bacteroidales bacterium]
MKKEKLHCLIEKEQPNICQVFIYKDGYEIYSDEWNNYKKSDSTHIMSATKSIVSLLIGIALDKGLINSIDDKILDYFPDYKVKRGERIIYDVNIKHLLTMTAPYKCKGDPWTKVCSSNDWTITSLDFLGGRKGITNEFRYQTVCLHILTGLLNKVSDMTPVDFANKYLFEPIGVQRHINYFAKTVEEHKDFTMNKKPKKNVWFCDPQNIGAAGYGLCFSAEDMAKIGLLCSNMGNYKGNQIVPSEWIDEITKPICTTGDKFRNMLYGYLWWIINKEKNIYAAIGNSGNVIYVDPENNLVVSVTSYFKPTVFDRIDFIEEIIKPLILNS